MDILYDIEKAILKDEHLSYDKAKEYFKLKKEFEAFVRDT